MSIALVMPGRETAVLVAALEARLPAVRIQRWPELAAPEEVRLAVLWQAPAGALEGLPALAAVISYGAGVDGILGDATIDPSLPIFRLVDPDLGRQVTGYVLAHVLPEVHGVARYRAQQADRRWEAVREPRQLAVTVLGLGTIGRDVADAFRRLGHQVTGWRRSPAADADLPVVTGRRALERALAGADVVISALPLTAATRGLWNAELLAWLPAGSVFVNVGRGEHVVEEDLLAALASGRPGRAILDVFVTEPLPREHPFWTEPRVTVTPHVAGLTDPRRAAGRIADLYEALAAGTCPETGAVDRARGY